MLGSCGPTGWRLTATAEKMYRVKEEDQHCAVMARTEGLFVTCAVSVGSHRYSLKIPEMIEYRNRLSGNFGLCMICGENADALSKKQTYPDGKQWLKE